MCGGGDAGGVVEVMQGVWWCCRVGSSRLPW